MFCYDPQSTVTYNKSPPTKGDRIEAALGQMKDSSAMMEAGLSEVLVKQTRHRKDFPEALDLLSNVSRRTKNSP